MCKDEYVRMNVYAVICSWCSNDYQYGFSRKSWRNVFSVLHTMYYTYYTSRLTSSCLHFWYVITIIRMVLVQFLSSMCLRSFTTWREVSPHEGITFLEHGYDHSPFYSRIYIFYYNEVWLYSRIKWAITHCIIINYLKCPDSDSRV